MRAFPTRRLTALLLALVTIGTTRAGDLVVSAASSLTNAFQAVAQGYQTAHPGTHVVLNFASSDTLLRQILNGAPADVYASADQVAMDRAQSQGAIVPGTRVDFAGNQLVVIVPAGTRAAIGTLADLARPEFQRIAWGDPASVPVGRYTQRVLQDAGLAARLAPRAVLAQNVRQCLYYVERDEVDAGFVYATDAAIAGDRVKLALRLPSPTPITYPVAVVAHSGHVAEAQSFIDYLRSAAGQRVMARFGFLAP